MIHKQIKITKQGECDCPFHRYHTAHIHKGRILSHSQDTWDEVLKRVDQCELENYDSRAYVDGMTTDEFRRAAIIDSAINSGRAHSNEELFRGDRDSCRALADFLEPTIAETSEHFSILAGEQGQDYIVNLIGKPSTYEVALVRDRAASWKAGAAHGAQSILEVVTDEALHRDKELLGRLRVIEVYISGIEGEIGDLTDFLKPEIKAIESDIREAESLKVESVDNGYTSTAKIKLDPADFDPHPNMINIAKRKMGIGGTVIKQTGNQIDEIRVDEVSMLPDEITEELGSGNGSVETDGEGDDS